MKLSHSTKVGFCFGLTSAVITTLGLMVGLQAGTNSQLVVIGGILTIAIADAFSDSLGIHISEESENKHTTREIWESTLATFCTKFCFALTFIIPVFIFPLKTAVMVSVAYGLLVLAVFSYKIALEEKAKPWRVVCEHLAIAGMVIIITHYAGLWIGSVFV